jgi:hypothetical protein
MNMAQNSSLGGRIVAQDLVIQRLLSQATIVGGIYTMGYDECLVLTNDLWKKQAGGIPQHCFLLATAMVPGQAPDVEDEEIILLRVIGPAALPIELSKLIDILNERFGTDFKPADQLFLDSIREDAVADAGIRQAAWPTPWRTSATSS